MMTPPRAAPPPARRPPSPSKIEDGRRPVPAPRPGEVPPIPGEAFLTAHEFRVLALGVLTAAALGATTMLLILKSLGRW